MRFIGPNAHLREAEFAAWLEFRDAKAKWDTARKAVETIAEPIDWPHPLLRDFHKLTEQCDELAAIVRHRRESLAEAETSLNVVATKWGAVQAEVSRLNRESERKCAKLPIIHQKSV